MPSIFEKSLLHFLVQITFFNTHKCQIFSNNNFTFFHLTILHQRIYPQALNKGNDKLEDVAPEPYVSHFLELLYIH